MTSHHSFKPQFACRYLAVLSLSVFPFVGCSNGGEDSLKDAGSRGATDGTGGAGPSGGATHSGDSGTGTGGNSPPQGGATGECSLSPVDWCMSESEHENEVCFTLDELKDPCSMTHILSVHEAPADPSVGGGLGGAPLALKGDGGTEDCPSAEDLFWARSNSSCGCTTVPTCQTPTRQIGNTCCYRASTTCLLC